MGAEQRALLVSRYGNLLMGAAGVLAAWLSHSQALLLDGLFSLVGFTATIVAGRITTSIDRLPDRRRPLGYAANESLYTTFRALSLLGLVAFAAGNAGLNITDYATGGALPELVYGPIVIYFVVISIVCFGLAANHYFAWKATDRQSDLLRLEAQATFFDGMMTVAAGIGLSVMPFLKTTPLCWITPIGDSLIVLSLCSVVVGRYFKDFKTGLGELAGVGVPDDQALSFQHRIAPILLDVGILIDLSVTRLGRSYQVQVYFDPTAPIAADVVDDLTRKCDASLLQIHPRTTTILIISRHGRVLREQGEDEFSTQRSARRPNGESSH